MIKSSCEKRPRSRRGDGISTEKDKFLPDEQIQAASKSPLTNREKRNQPGEPLASADRAERNGHQRGDIALLAAAGAALMLTQYVAVREISSSFFSTELVVIGAVLVAMVGPSIGYAISHRIDRWLLTFWGAVSVATHLAMPVGLRALVGEMAARQFESFAIGVTVVGGSVLLCGFYAVFLPRRASGPLSLRVLYGAELLGALFALIVIFLSPSWHWILAAYWTFGAVVIHLGLRKPLLSAAIGVAVLVMIAMYPRLDKIAAAAYYRGYYGHDSPAIVETVYSPYQRIDVVDDAGERSLYLDGVPFFRGGELSYFNVFLAEIPALLQPEKGHALVVGSGSFSSAAFVKRQGYDVTVVELDGSVADVGFRRFADVHGLKEGDVDILIGDGRRILKQFAPETFDLIVLDVPAPYHIQTAMLYTPSFYTLVLSRLRPNGVASLSLCGYSDDPVGAAIAASAVSVFPDVVAVESYSARLMQVYGARKLPFSSEQIAKLVDEYDPVGGEVLTDSAVRRQVENVEPLTLRRLDIVWLMARSVLPELGGGQEMVDVESGEGPNE